MVKSRESSFKSVHKDKCEYHYPQIPENQLREKGEIYFHLVELTGSLDSSAKKPKLSLITTYSQFIFPDMDKVAREHSNGGSVKVVIVKQMDGAGPHCETKFKNFMTAEFSKRDWLLFPQPPNSPTTNTCDDCVFPMQSKHFLSCQGLMFGSRLMKGEEKFPDCAICLARKNKPPIDCQSLFLLSSDILCNSPS